MKRFQTALITVLLFAASSLRADVNILILGSDSAGDQRYVHTLTQGAQTGTPPFLFEEVATHLRQILEGAGHGSVNVTTQNIAAGEIELVAGSTLDRRYSSNLVSWFHWPYGEFKGGNFWEVTGTGIPRWTNLRGEGDTRWDYVVLIEDPATIERYPGLFAVGAARIAEEVAKGSGEAVLLMPWPAPGSSASLDHYQEVVYRVGRSAGIPVAPAGLAWQAAGAPTGATHPSSDGSYIAAATLYSRLFGQSASASAYSVDDTLADSAHNTVQTNQGETQYSGDFDFAHPTRLLGDKRRLIVHSNRGTSSENRLRRELSPDSFVTTNVDWNWTRETYNSDTPDDDGLGWPYTGTQLPIAMNYGRHHAFSGDGPSKSYFTNPDFWQLGFGFAYQNTSDSVAARGLMAGRDMYVAFLMGEGTTLASTPQSDPDQRSDEIETARVIPIHLLFSEIQRQFPDQDFRPDNTHLNRALDVAAATYMHTIYSGRTPVDDVATGDDLVPDPELNRFAQMLGYETAWMAGTLQARAPAFKVRPNGNDTGAASEEFTIRFLNPPRSVVTVLISVTDDTLAEVSHDTLVFTPQNYSQPVTVSSRAKNRNTAANPGYAVQFTTVSNDEVFDGLTDSWNFNMPSNAAPSIDIAAPAEGANFPVGSDLTVSVHSADPDGSVAHVTLWVNGTLVRQDSAAPYEWSPALGDSPLANLADDVYALRIQAVDNQGAAHTVTRTITVGTPGTTPPAAPANLTASPAFALVTLDWGDNTEADFLSYSVYRSTTPGSYGGPLAAGLTSSEYIDTEVDNDTTYYYVVTAMDRFFNESAFSGEKEATPGIGANAARFGSERDGYGGFTTGSVEDGESWTLLPTSVRYINEDADGPGGADGGTRNGTLLKEYTLDRSEGSSYRFQGVVHLTDGYADDNNRIGIYLFGGVPQPGGTETGALHLVLNLDNNTLSITRGINGTAIASTAKLGALTGGALFGTDLVFTAEIAFTGTTIDISFSLTDQNFDITTVGTSVAATEFTGEFFGFATRARTRGTVGKTNPWTMDYKNFGVGVTLLADENGNGINDYWELANFDNELLDESETHHPGGTDYYFLYLAGWNDGDPLDQAGRIGMVREVGGSNPVISWEFAEGFELGVHAEVWISTDLVDWAPLPSAHYSLTTHTTNGRTRHELEVTHNYGDTVYLRLRKP